jgi:hypothetical protein
MESWTQPSDVNPPLIAPQGSEPAFWPGRLPSKTLAGLINTDGLKRVGFVKRAEFPMDCQRLLRMDLGTSPEIRAQRTPGGGTG